MDVYIPPPWEEGTGYETVLPGASWADLAEHDPEMRLMGMPVLPPEFVANDDFIEWTRPKRPARRVKRTPVALKCFEEPFKNSFMPLAEEDETEVGDEVKACWSEPVPHPPELCQPPSSPASTPSRCRPEPPLSELPDAHSRSAAPASPPLLRRTQ